MKITKLIIPLLGLTSITNSNKQELLQLEKTPEISYEVSINDNWNNYYLTDTNTTENVEYSQQDKNFLSENLIQDQVIFTQLDTQKKEFGGIISHANCKDVCDLIYEKAYAVCCAALWNPAAFAVCAAAAGTALGLCYVACRD